MGISRCSLACVIALLAANAAVAQSQIVFNSLGTGPANGITYSHDPGESNSATETVSGGENLSQVAQRFSLSGTARHVQQIDVQFEWFIGIQRPVQSFDATLRLYAVGADGLPSSLLWGGTADNVSFPASASSGRTASFSFFPDIDVPDSIWFSTSESDIILTPGNSGDGWGWSWRTRTSPQIGAASWWAEQDTTTGLWQRNSGLDTGPTSPSVIAARITAVPAPATIATALVGLATLARRRRS